MNVHPCVLIDPERADLFTLLALPGRFSGVREARIGDDGVHWAVVPSDSGGSAVAVNSVAPAWMYTAPGRDRHADRWAQLSGWRATAGPAEHRVALGREIGRVRTGPLLARLLWLVHIRLMKDRCSLLDLADHELGVACYGVDQNVWPAHWRGTAIDILRSATRLHFAARPPTAGWTFGERTPALLHVGDLKGTPADRCSTNCPWYGRGRHHHVLVNVGPGFLGSLEQFASEAEPGVRTYLIPATGRKGTPSLRELGRRQQVCSQLVAPNLGAPGVCRLHPLRQRRLLAALYREQTRAPGKKTRDTGPFVLAGNGVPGWNGRGHVCCPGLGPADLSVAFAGNGARRGLGYRLAGPGGWLARAGYAPDQLGEFFSELGALGTALALVPVAVCRNGHAYSLSQMVALAAAPPGRARLANADVRVYAPADFLERVSAYFQWPPPFPPMPDAVDVVLRLSTVRRERRLTQGQVARELGLDASFFSRLLRGEASWPAAVLDRARDWVERAPGPATSRTVS